MLLHFFENFEALQTNLRVIMAHALHNVLQHGHVERPNVRIRAVINESQIRILCNVVSHIREETGLRHAIDHLFSVESDLLRACYAD